MNICYAIIDSIKEGDEFINVFSAESEALKRATYETAIMSKHDKKRRQEYAIYKGCLDDDGCFDSNTAQLVLRYI